MAKSSLEAPCHHRNCCSYGTAWCPHAASGHRPLVGHQHPDLVNPARQDTLGIWWYLECALICFDEAFRDSWIYQTWSNYVTGNPKGIGGKPQQNNVQRAQHVRRPPLLLELLSCVMTLLSRRLQCIHEISWTCWSFADLGLRWLYFSPFLTQWKAFRSASLHHIFGKKSKRSWRFQEEQSSPTLSSLRQFSKWMFPKAEAFPMISTQGFW